MNIEVYLGNWGTVICQNAEHRTYLNAAKRLSDIKSAIGSWHGNWLSEKMKQNYLKNEQSAQSECERLWLLIPNKTNDLSKSH